MTKEIKNTQNPRALAFKMLCAIEEKHAYPDEEIRKKLKESDMPKNDRALCTLLLYGVTEKRLTLDYVLSGLSKRPFEKIDEKLKALLRLGAYQILFCDKIPDSAACDESVKLAKKFCGVSTTGFVNGILRSLCRNKEISYPEYAKDKTRFLSVKYSISSDIVGSFLRDYGEEKTKEILEAFSANPDTTIRVNTLKISEEELLKLFLSEGIETSKTCGLNGVLKVRFTSEIEKVPGFLDGYFFVQDVSSALSVLSLSPKAGEKVLDLCAAPGGKSFLSSILMKNTGEIFAFDLYDHKIEKINDGVKRLGLLNIHSSVGDAGIFQNEFSESADKVILDAPCSGLGILSKKPDIRYKTKEEITSLPEIQKKLIKNASRYVKKGGELLYSTCTLSKQENEEVIFEFLRENQDFSLEKKKIPELLAVGIEDFPGYVTIFPKENRNDGFFISILRRGE